MIGSQAGLLGELEPRVHADPDKHEVRPEPAAVLELHASCIDALQVVPQVKLDSRSCRKSALEAASRSTVRLRQIATASCRCRAWTQHAFDDDFQRDAWTRTGAPIRPPLGTQVNPLR